MGSGKLLNYAIAKYGIENFRKEILHIFDNAEAMNAKERELVVVSESTYNLNVGGNGGFGYINTKGLNRQYPGKREQNIINGRKGPAGYKRYLETTDHAAKIRSGVARWRAANPDWVHPWKGQKHTSETKEYLRQLRSGTGTGQNNSQHGTCWVTNDQHNLKIKLVDLDQYTSQGYRRGRVFQKKS